MKKRFKQLKGKELVRFSGYKPIEIEGFIMLVNDTDGSIHVLDGVSSALWRQLAAPKTVGEVYRSFLEILPNADKKKMKMYIGDSLHSMIEKRIVVEL